jgi:hypothetical protein
MLGVECSASLNRASRAVLATVLLLLAVLETSAAVVNDFARYEVILQRRPFGEAPSDAETAASLQPPVQTGPSFVDALTMCAITSGGGAVRVGFVDTKAQPPKTYFLFVGESEDGIEVVDADYEQESVTLRKNSDTRILKMGGGLGSALAPVADSKSSMREAAFARLRRSRTKRTKEQIEEERRLAIERKSPILKGEEYETHIRQYNMDLIRSGGDMGVPLPITLTPEEDAQLVSEGALPPPLE